MQLTMTISGLGPAYCEFCDLMEVDVPTGDTNFATELLTELFAALSFSDSAFDSFVKYMLSFSLPSSPLLTFFFYFILSYS